MAVPHEITPARLLRLIATPDCPVVVDISIKMLGSLRHSRDTLKQLEAGMKNDDALCRCACDGVDGTNGWPARRME